MLLYALWNTNLIQGFTNSPCKGQTIKKNPDAVNPTEVEEKMQRHLEELEKNGSVLKKGPNLNE